MKSFLAAVSCALLMQIPVVILWSLPIMVPSVLSGYGFFRTMEFLGIYLFYVGMVALPIILIIGFPVYLALRSVGRTSQQHLFAAGAVVAVVLASIILGPSMLSFTPGSSSAQTYYGTYRQMVVDGVPTLWGWIRYGETMLIYALHGAVGAVGFHRGWAYFEAPNAT